MIKFDKLLVATPFHFISIHEGLCALYKRTQSFCLIKKLREIIQHELLRKNEIKYGIKY